MQITEKTTPLPWTLIGTHVLYINLCQFIYIDPFEGIKNLIYATFLSLFALIDGNGVSLNISFYPITVRYAVVRW